MTFNDTGLALLKEFEGCRLEAYQDIAGHWTIGYGHRLSSYTLCDGYVIDQAQADLYLEEDANQTASYVTKLLTRELDDYEFSAVVCLAYNIGSGALAKSETLKLVNADQNPTQEWLGFDHSEGTVIPGLLRRRQAELQLYFTV